VSSDPSVARSPAAGFVTPDAVPLDLETATVGSRAVAYVLDLLLIGTGYVLLGLATAALGGGGFVPGWAGIAVLLVLVFALQFGYPIGFETLWRGRTPGKAAMGLRVVTLEGAPVGVRHAAVRTTVGLFELLLLLGAPAVITSLVSPRGQRLGDLAAGTLVIRERRARTALSVSSHAAPPGYEAYTGQLDISALGPQDYATVRETLRRLPTLPDDVTRSRIAGQVAGALAPRVTPAPPASVTAETWLRCVAAAFQARRAPGPRRPGADRRGASPEASSPSWGPPSVAADPTSTAERSTPPPRTTPPHTPPPEPPSGDGFVPPS
jgi:uncharacterized RDD family membrane protein YckC